MANQLDELNPTIRDEGLDTNVIAKQITVTVGFAGLLYQAIVWLSGLVPLAVGILLIVNGRTPGYTIGGALVCCLCAAPGLCLYFKKQGVRGYFDKLEQRVQAAASRVDNYLEQRVVVLTDCAKLLEKQLRFERDTYSAIAALRTGTPLNDVERNDYAEKIDRAAAALKVNFEAYPELRGNQAIADAMQQNLYLQKEITAARDLYNAEVSQWNTQIFEFPLKRIVAAEQGYHTRIPFIASKEIKERAKGSFF